VRAVDYNQLKRKRCSKCQKVRSVKYFNKTYHRPGPLADSAIGLDVRTVNTQTAENTPKATVLAEMQGSGSGGRLIQRRRERRTGGEDTDRSTG
jgi:hypothetical protein